MALGLGFLGPLLSAFAAGIKAFNDHRAAANTAAKVQEKTAQNIQVAQDKSAVAVGSAMKGDSKALDELRREASE